MSRIMGRMCYLNGKFIPESELKISAYDLSVAQGVAAFEMTRSFNGVHFKLRAHLERLLASCRALSLSFPWTLDEVEGWCHDTAARNDHGPGEEHRLLIVVSPGCAPMYRELDGVIPHPFLYIADFPLRYTVAGFGKYFTEGVHCVTSKIQQVPDACFPSAAKHRSRLHFHLAQMQAPAGTWPILTTGYYNELNGANFCEAPGANLVYVQRGQIYTIGKECLGGISLQTIRELAATHESDGLRDCDAHTIDELWLTGTPFCAISVASLDGKPIGDGKPGPVYKAMMEKWNDLVGLNIQEQIATWDLTASRNSTSN